MTQPLYQSTIESLPLLGRGKVRDNYAVNGKDGDQMLVTWGETKDQWSIVGGTGKFKGITGSGTTGKFELLRDRGDEWTGVGHETISWEIK